MSSVFYVDGYQPATDRQAEAHLMQWLKAQVQSGQLNPGNGAGRRPMCEDRRDQYGIVWERRVWNFVDMQVAGVPSKGYIELLQSTNRSGMSSQTWYAIRCLPETEDLYYIWRHGTNSPSSDQRCNAMDMRLHLGYNRQYNRTLADRIRHDNGWRGTSDLHASVVADMAQLGRSLIAIACFQLSIAVSISRAMNPIPLSGEMAGRMYAR